MKIGPRNEELVAPLGFSLYHIWCEYR